MKRFRGLLALVLVCSALSATGCGLDAAIQQADTSMHGASSLLVQATRSLLDIADKGYKSYFAMWQKDINDGWANFSRANGYKDEDTPASVDIKIMLDAEEVKAKQTVALESAKAEWAGIKKDTEAALLEYERVNDMHFKTVQEARQAKIDAENLVKHMASVVAGLAAGLWGPAIIN